MRRVIYNFNLSVARALIVIFVVQRSCVREAFWESFCKPTRMTKGFFPFWDNLLCRIPNENYAIETVSRTKVGVEISTYSTMASPVLCIFRQT